MGTMRRAELRGTRCYVVWGANLKGRLFFLGSSAGRAGRRGKTLSGTWGTVRRPR